MFPWISTILRGNLHCTNYFEFYIYITILNVINYNKSLILFLLLMTITVPVDTEGRVFYLKCCLVVANFIASSCTGGVLYCDRSM
jgi:hypothetical protein